MAHDARTPQSATVAAEQSATGSLPHVYDVLIIGAGPCGLAVAARVREKTPSALFTDDEHRRYHWIARDAATKSRKSGRASRRRAIHANAPPPPLRGEGEEDHPSMLVLDSSGADWLCRWRSLFAALEIPHLRSPMFFHPDPRDRDGLLAFAHAHGRSCECFEITGCVGKEVSKHRQKKKRREQHRGGGGGGGGHMPPTIEERDRKDYFAPSSKLFDDYCDEVVQRYGLCGEEMIRKETVQDVDFGVVERVDAVEKIFTVRTGDAVHFARAVVLAVGAGGSPKMPKPFAPDDCACVCHALQGVQAGGSAGTVRNLLVVGGGLTAAQVADQAIKHGTAHVWLLVRGRLRAKPFDVDLHWMGKYHNNEKASFWSADTDAERAAMIDEARGGGSITSRYSAILKQHVRRGRLTIHTHTVIDSQRFIPGDRTWCITTDPPVQGLPHFNHISFATGVQSDVRNLGCLQTMARKCPVDCCNGLPALTDDLKWQEGVPLFVTGRLAGLRLGPGAGNLEGARLGAERIAWALEGADNGKTAGAQDNVAIGALRYAMGVGSRFEQLPEAE